MTWITDGERDWLRRGLSTHLERFCLKRKDVGGKEQHLYEVTAGEYHAMCFFLGDLFDNEEKAYLICGEFLGLYRGRPVFHGPDTSPSIPRSTAPLPE